MKYFLTPLRLNLEVQLYNNNFEYKVNNKAIDDSGNYLALDINISNIRATLVVVYGPNKDDPSFYEMISEAMNNFENDNIILVGDFNLVLDVEKYCHNYLHVNNPKAREKVLEMISSHNLNDIFREFHPEKTRYTWRMQASSF